MNNIKKIDKRNTIKTVTSNTFITAKGLSDLSLKARKLLYIAISQCRKTDQEFYTYEISAKDFAELMDIDVKGVYPEVDEITEELMGGRIQVRQKNKNHFRKYTLFSLCEYNDGILLFKLNPDMTNFLLNLKRDFSQPLLEEFLKMRSPYSMSIWHLMQRAMHSRLPGVMSQIEFDLSLDELREVTGCQDKLKQIGEFKTRVFDKAIREIKDNCGVVVKYENIKTGRKIVGFHCTATNLIHINENDIPRKKREEVRRKATELNNKAKIREMTAEEIEKYEEMTKDAEQMELIFN